MNFWKWISVFVLLFSINVFCYFLSKVHQYTRYFYELIERNYFYEKFYSEMTLFDPKLEFWLERLFSLMFTGLDFLNQNFSYDLGCIRSKWCCCDHINRPRINILQHSSFRKPILATLHNIVLNFSPEQAWAVACLKHVSVFWDIWSFLTKKTSFYEK